MTRKLTITFLTAAAFAVGCNPATEQKTEPMNSQTAGDKVKKETKEAKQAMKDYAYAQRAEFVTQMKSESAKLNQELDQLAEKIEKAGDTAKAGAKSKLQALREKSAQFNKQLDDANAATESTWESIKTASKKSYEELKDSFQQSRKWLSEKIAP